MQQYSPKIECSLVRQVNIISAKYRVQCVLGLMKGKAMELFSRRR